MGTSLEFSDYVSYWLQLFPEINKPDELEEILQNVSETSLNDLQQEVERGQDHALTEELVERFFSCSRMSLMTNISAKIIENFPFYFFMEPIINLALSQHYLGIMDSSILEGTEDFWENTVTQLTLTLFKLAERTIILEINVAREDNLLLGATPEMRFQYFTDVLLKDPEYLKRLYKEYPVLIELLYTKACRHLEYIAEVLKNTEAELPSIAKKVNGDVVGKIVGITTGMGDTHQGGKTVSILTFNTGAKIVYKPRHTEQEENFQRLLQWQEAKSSSLLVNKYIKVHSGSGCGWIEYLEYKECKDSKEVERFYIRIGQLLCLLYSLNAKDFHHENLLASGEYPVLLDVESLFHSNQGMTCDENATAFDRASCILGKSVYSTGLLPQKLTNPSDIYSDRSIDVSGLGGGVAQISPFQALHVVDDKTDRIRLENKYGSILPKDNSPKVEGEVQESVEYIDSIKKGFTNMYRFLIENRDDYMPFIERLFSSNQNRFILRPSYLYVQLLATSYHPDFLRDSIHRRVLLHRIGIGEKGDGRQVLASEYHDLLAGEVPFYNIGIDSLTLLDSRGNEIPGLIEKTPMEEVHEKVRSLSKEDLDFQLNLVDTAFAAKVSNSKKDATNISFDLSLQTNKLTPKRWLKLATEIGEYIIQKGITGKNDEVDITWLGIILEGWDELTWSLAPVGVDIYNGNSGIALFLGYLGALTGESHITKAAFQAAVPLRQRIEALDSDHPYNIGAFNGISGYFYTLAKLWKLTGDKDLEGFILRNLPIWKALLDKDKLFDVISGSAGSMAVSLTLEDCLGDKAGTTFKEMIALSYQHIAGNPREFPLGISWGFKPQHIPYSGFAHGNAGIAAFLARYYARTMDPSAIHLIKRTLELERGLYSAKHKNWFPSLAKDRISSGWCHGAPGILLSKVILLESGYEDDQLRQEIEIAQETSLSSLGYNTSLCHGDLGNIAILKYASKILNQSEIDNASTSAFQELFNSVLVKRWKDGLFRGTESLGLMVGLAGVGYAILKHFAPDFVPEVLALD